jgi:hypothetical protein
LLPEIFCYEDVATWAISHTVMVCAHNNLIDFKIFSNLELQSALLFQERNYPGFLKSMFRVGKEEGIKGLWRGTGAALLREASYSSIRMGAYEPLKTVSKLQILTNNFADL